MKTLRSEAIKLAHQNPSLRPHLLPLLKRGSGEGSWSDLVEFGSVRSSLGPLLDDFVEQFDTSQVFYSLELTHVLGGIGFSDDRDYPTTPGEFREFLAPIQKELKTLAASDSLTREQKISAQRILNQIAAQIKAVETFAAKVNVALDNAIRSYLHSLVEAQKRVVERRRALLSELEKLPQELLESRAPLKKALGVGMVDGAMAGLEKAIDDTNALLKSTYR